MFSSFRPKRTAVASNEVEPGLRASPAQVRRLLGYLRPYGKPMAVAAIALLVGSGIGLAFPLVIKQLVDAVIAKSDAGLLNGLAVALLVLFFARSVFYYLQNYHLAYVGERLVVDLRRQLYAHLHLLGLRFYSDRRVGEILSRLSSDVTLVRSVLTRDLANALAQVLSFIGALVIMLVINWRLTMAILVLAPAVAVSGAVFGRRLRAFSTTVQDQLADSSALAEQAFNNIRVVKSFVREALEIHRYREAVDRTLEASLQLARYRSAFGSLISFLAFGAVTAIVWFGGREMLAGRLSAGELLSYLVYAVTVAAAAGSITGLYTQLQESLGATRRIFELLDEPAEIRDSPGARPLPQVNGHIVFDHVSFRYDSDVPVLHDINLEIQPGEVLALVGPSGAGKSTLFNLIPRFYDPSGGRVLMDGHDLREVQVFSLRTGIGLVPQETQLFSGTIRENIRYGKPDATDAELTEAAKIANAYDFIMAFGPGFDQLVGERGVKLSGGERQRIAIARAALKDPRVLLLDEATSSLDVESEGLVREALGRLMDGRTTVVIAHRHTTIQQAHRVAVIQAGRLAELGSHRELMAHDGLYARLYQLQFSPELQDLALGGSNLASSLTSTKENAKI